MQRLVCALCLFLFWTLFVFLCPDTVYWRDSGEFLVSAFLLDIPHPPGFTTYSMGANLLALLPLGSIPWRIHLFSLLCGAAVLVLSYQVSRSLVPKHLSSFFPILAPILLLVSAAFVRGNLTAEVYMLSAVFVLAMCLFYIKFRESGDLRHILAAAFISGLAVGVHPSLVPFIFVAIALLLTQFSKTKKALIPSALLAISGSLTLVYIPIRAAVYPALNTGGAIFGERFFNFITNARDSALRADGMTGIGGAGADSWANYFASFAGDIARIELELPLLAVAVGILGLLSVSRKDWRISLLLLSGVITNLLFFKGWQADPWIPSLALLSIGTVVMLATHLMYRFGFILVLAIGGLLAAPLTDGFSRSMIHGRALSQFKLPAQTVKAQLAALPPKAFYISEPSWFLVNYLSIIEGIRTDITYGYLPQFLFPKFFSPFILEDSFSTENATDESANKVNYVQLFKLFNMVGQEVFFEPVQTINSAFKDIAVIKPPGLLSLSKGVFAEIVPESSTFVIEQSALIHDIDDSLLKEDSVNYFEALASGRAESFVVKESFKPALEILRSLCLTGDIENSPCSVVALNNYGVYLMRAGEYEKAANVFSKIIEKTDAKGLTVKQNLDIAKGKLNHEEDKEY